MKSHILIVIIPVVTFLFLAVNLSITSQAILPSYQETPIPIATLAVMRETIQDSLTDETCVLPCFMGWNVGEDNRDEVAENFEKLFTVEADFRCENGYCREWFAPCLPTHTPRSRDCIAVAVWVNSHNTLVGVGFTIETSFSEEWLIPAQIASGYGLPETVELEITITPFSTLPWYRLLTAYPAQGLYVRYHDMVEQLDAESHAATICPSNNVQGIDIWVQSEPVPDNGWWIELVSDEVWIEDDFEEIPIEITDENFEDIFYDPEVCFTIEIPEQKHE